jgi:hypothetical protein
LITLNSANPHRATCEAYYFFLHHLAWPMSLGGPFFA